MRPVPVAVQGPCIIQHCIESLQNSTLGYATAVSSPIQEAEFRVRSVDTLRLRLRVGWGGEDGVQAHTACLLLCIISLIVSISLTARLLFLTSPQPPSPFSPHCQYHCVCLYTFTPCKSLQGITYYPLLSSPKQNYPHSSFQSPPIPPSPPPCPARKRGPHLRS